MAYSIQRAVSDGTMTLLPVSIGYFDREEISVLFNGVLNARQWAWVGTTDKTLSFTPAVANTVEVMVVRSTDLSELRHQFSLGAQFTAESLDESLLQVLHIAQEATERQLGGDFFTNIDMHGSKIANIGTGTAPGDAVNKAQMDVHNTEIIVYRDAAAASAAAAAASAAAVLVSENNAASSAAAALHPWELEAGGIHYDLGNMRIGGIGKRITGDFSNATIANRLLFQSSTTNGETNVLAIPNGTGNVATLQAGNSSDPNNQAVISINAKGSECSINSHINGTGSYLPMTFYTGGSERMRIGAAGNVDIGLVSGYSKLNVLGNVEFRGPQNGTATSVGAFLKGADGTQAGYWGFGSIASPMEYVNSRGTGHVWYDGGSERMRIGGAGQLGIGGANYGSAGQVLTSNGPSAAPSWKSSGMFKTSASAPYTPAGGETLTRAHGLGFAPTSCQLVFECVVADAGYAVGEITYPTGVWNGTSTFLFGMYSDATNCGIKCWNTVWVYIVHKTTGGAVTPTANAWKYYFVGLR